MGNADHIKEPTLKTLRECQGFSQESLGARLSLSKNTIGAWEAGRKIPRFDNAIALARELRVSLKDLAAAMGLETLGIPEDEDN
jgi:transcriptional regulator with XRE-family HTH domain